MALNSYFPATYQPVGYNQPAIPQYLGQNPLNSGLYQQGQTNPQPNQNIAQNGIIWVSGESGARGFMVAPNQTVQLWDSEAQTIYLKSADMSGMPSMKILDYTIREEGKKNDVLQPQAQFDASMYVTRDELEKRLKEIVSHGTKRKAENNESDIPTVRKQKRLTEYDEEF